MKFKLVGEEGAEYEIFSKSDINTKWKAEAIQKETLKLDLSNVPAGEYTMCIGLFDSNTPIKLGFKSECDNGDGFYGFDKIDVK